MSEEQGKPFEVVGDEALEARVVAWALGEVSGFEIEELERLCEEQPELEVFRRRIVAVHGLAGEGLKKPETDWRLPAVKRQKVLDAIGGQASEARRERSSRFAARRLLLVAAACVVLTVVVAGLMTPAVLRAKKGGIGEAADLDIRGGAREVQFLEHRLGELDGEIRDQESVVEQKRKAPAAEPMAYSYSRRPAAAGAKPAAPSKSTNREILGRSAGTAGYTGKESNREKLGGAEAESDDYTTTTKGLQQAEGQLADLQSESVSLRVELEGKQAELGTRLRRRSLAGNLTGVPEPPPTPAEPAGAVAKSEKPATVNIAGEAFAGKRPKMVPLSTDLPEELIEGTPKKIDMPGLAENKPAHAQGEAFGGGADSGPGGRAGARS